MSKIQVVWFRDLSLWDFKSNGFNPSNELFKSKYPLVKISEFLKRNKTQTIIKDEVLYIRVTISGKASFNGATVRDKVYGKNIGIKKQYKIKEGQFLVSKIGAGDGAFGIATNELNEAIITSDFWAFDYNQSRINPYFLLFMVKTKKFISFARASSSGTALKRMNENKFLGAKIPLPPLEIQNKIVADIHAIQTKIKALQVEEKRLKDEIETYIYIALGLQKPQSVQKQKVFVVRFKNLERWDTTYNQNKTINLYSSNTKFSKSKYPLVALGEICTTNVGLTYEPKNISNTKQGIAVLRSNNIQNGKIDYNDLVYVDNTDIPNNKIANKGDLIICVRNGSANLVGKTAMIEKNGMSFGAFMAIIRSKYNPYLYHFLQTDIFRNSVFEARTSGINQISQSDIKNFKIPLPPLQIQKEMVENIEQKTSQISKMSQERIALQNSIESQLQKMLID